MLLEVVAVVAVVVVVVAVVVVAVAVVVAGGERKGCLGYTDHKSIPTGW